MINHDHAKFLRKNSLLARIIPRMGTHARRKRRSGHEPPAGYDDSSDVTDSGIFRRITDGPGASGTDDRRKKSV